MSPLLFFALIASTPGVPVAAPVTTTEASDSRCLAALSYLVGADPKLKDQAQLGATYFLGKLLGRNPTIDIEAALRASLPALQVNLAGETQRCGTELQVAGKAMQAAGRALQGK